MTIKSFILLTSRKIFLLFEFLLCIPWVRSKTSAIAVFLSRIADRKISICLYTLLILEAACEFGLFIYVDVLEHSKRSDHLDEQTLTFSSVAVGGLAVNVTVCGVGVIPPWRWGLVDW